MSKCRWCGGSGGECGCGRGFCDHCGGSGVTVDAPLGATTETTFPEEVVRRLAEEWCDRPRIPTPDGESVWGATWIREQSRFIRQWEAEVLMFLSGGCWTPLLTEDEVRQFAMFWSEPYRDHTLGDYINCVANVVEQRYNATA